MDVGNTAYQQACVAEVIAIAKANGFDGVYWDDVNYSLSWSLRYSGATIPAYPTDDSWQKAHTSFLTYAEAQIHAASLLLMGNIASNGPTCGGAAPNCWQQWNTLMDGAMEQSWTDGSLGPAQQIPYWPNKLVNAAWSEAHGKVTILDAFNSTEAGNTYGIASMLLVAGGNLTYGTDNSSPTLAETWYLEYTTAQQLGAAVGAYSQLANGVYKRQFANGVVLVNPTASSVATFSLGGGTYSGSGLTGVASVSLPPTTGYVLLKDP
jgi:hypothetical protein